MGRADFLLKGSWSAICDRCGRKFHADDLKLEWDGVRVCKDCWEIRQPQDLVRAKADKQAPPWTRPDQNPDNFTPAVCATRSSVAGVAVAGCAIAGLVPGV